MRVAELRRDRCLIAWSAAAAQSGTTSLRTKSGLVRFADCPVAEIAGAADVGVKASL